MATVQDRINQWRKGELRGASQVNMEVALNRYNKGLLKFQKELLEYVANNGLTTSVVLDTEANRDTYSLPFEFSGQGITSDFYSIAQLRVAYDENNDHPAYRVCTAINIADYNMTPKGHSIWEPMILRRISAHHPRYSFVSVYEDGKTQTHIKLYPTPKKSITGGISLTFNYVTEPVSLNTNEDKIGLPRYFLDAVEDYLSYRLMQAENPELAGQYYQNFITTLHDNIYGMNRDKRPVEEEFADFYFFTHN